MTDGYLHLIIGPMFSGKTSELLRCLFNEAAVDLNVLYVNHERDNRSSGPYSTHNPLYKEQLASMSNVSFLSVKSLESLSGCIHKYDVIGIDEAQFFSDINTVIHWVDDMGKKVLISGLDGDFRRERFGGVLDLIPKANKVEKLTAYCKMCAGKTPKIIKLAYFTKRIVASEEVILVGSGDSYLPVCRGCYVGEKRL